MIGFAILAVLVLSTSLGKKRGASSATKALTSVAIHEFDLVNSAETKFRATHGRYTGNFADLVDLDAAVAPPSPLLAVELQTSANGNTYVARVVGPNIVLTRAMTSGRKVEGGCEFIGSHKGLTCPPG